MAPHKFSAHYAHHSCRYPLLQILNPPLLKFAFPCLLHYYCSLLQTITLVVFTGIPLLVEVGHHLGGRVDSIFVVVVVVVVVN